MQLMLEPLWPWPLVVLAALALSALVTVAYLRQTQTLSPPRRRLLLALKLTSLAVVVFALFRPAILVSQQEKNTGQVLVLTDVSRSMNTADATGGRTRLQAALHDFDQHADHWAALAKQLAIRRFEFDRELRPWKEGRTAGDGDQTALGQALEDALREARQQSTAAILLQSDGAQRALPPHDGDPLLAARKLSELQIPVYAVGYGATALSSNTVDLAVRDLLVNSVVFEKKLVPLKVQLHAQGARGRKTQLRVLVEDRGSVPLGEAAPMMPAPLSQSARPVQEIAFRADQDIVPVDLSFVPNFAGELKIAVEALPIEGEMLTTNNRVETIITVRQGGLRVAYFDLPRPEQRMLRIVNTEEKIQLDYFDIRGGRFRSQTVITPEWFERGKYDVYLIGDVPADVFGPKLLEMLAERVREGAGFMMLGGLQNFSAGGYASTPVGDLLPVVLAPAGPSTTPSLQGQLVGPQPMVPTELGLKRFVMQLAPAEKNRARWETLAPLVGATRLVPKHELVEVWAQTRDGSPLLLAAEVGKARVVAFGGDTTYQWVLHGQGEEHQRFWRQMILWLARKEADAGQEVWVRVDPRNYAPGATVSLECGARDPLGRPLNGATFRIDVTGPDGKTVSPTPRETPGGAAADFTQTVLPGDYWVRVSATKNGQVLGLGAVTRFIVDQRDLELDQPNADYDLLRKIAEITGGQLLQSENLAGFLQRLANLEREDLSRVTVISLWDNPWVLLLFVGLLTAEWAFRRKWGLA
uniref:Putative glutamine amidotransferase domain-containing protein n=1 Tax=Schlesneria paludicola TaxID=360056 RepID=A0A7C4LMF8_9PLAN